MCILKVHIVNICNDRIEKPILYKKVLVRSINNGCN